MDVKNMKMLAEQYSFEELQTFADQFESTGVAPVKTSEDAGDQMSDYLMAAEIKFLMDKEKIPHRQLGREYFPASLRHHHKNTEWTPEQPLKELRIHIDCEEI